LKKGLISVKDFGLSQQNLTKEAKMNELEIIELFCLVDDFTHRFEQISSQKSIQYMKKRVRKRKFRTSLSEVLTILILFHRSRTFQHFYLNHVCQILKPLFFNPVGYSCFVQLPSDAFFPMFCLA